MATPTPSLETPCQCRLLLEPDARAAAVLFDELNSSLFQSLLHRVDRRARHVASGFFKIDDR
jgi:hypothetical protein